MKRLLALCCLLSSLSAPRLLAQDPALNLALGDPARRDRQAPLLLDAITDTRKGDILSPPELAARLADVRLLFVGENHTNHEFHQAQLRIVQELARSGRQVLIGLEMYPYTDQVHLDRWVAGGLTEEAFLEQSQWYRAWGYHWNYYREIFLFARDHKLRMFAVNTPREVVSAVRSKGFQNLTPEEAAHVPDKIDTDSPEYRQLFRAFFSEQESVHSSMSEEQRDGMFRAQCTWDATMAYNAVQALKAQGGPNAIMVVLIGAGHVAYDLGAPRQATSWFQGKTASLIPIPVVSDQGEAVKVRASYAQFLWGLPKETDPLYPFLGLSTSAKKAGDFYRVLAVEKDSVAAAAGFAAGDLLVSMDGTPLQDKETLNRLMAGKRWGDVARFEIRRVGETMTLGAALRRRQSEKP
jgi:uncharacterized iron-regulated protein